MTILDHAERLMIDRFGLVAGATRECNTATNEDDAAKTRRLLAIVCRNVRGATPETEASSPERRN